MRAAALVTVALVVAARPAAAGDALSILDVRVDRATLHAAGVQVVITGDDDHDATIRVRRRYRTMRPVR